MERQDFYFLYVNLNSLAELAFKQAAARVLAQLPAAAVPEQLSPEEIEAHVAASFENLDLSALDGLGVPSTDDEPLDLEALSQQADQEFAALEQTAAAGELSDGAADGEVDIEQYMARAYGHEEKLRERIDGHYRRADLTVLSAALEQLPPDLRSLTKALSADDMREWLKLYDEGHEALTDLTVRVRQLDV